MNKYLQDGEENFRCKYLKNEYLAQLVIDGKRDWYTVVEPEVKHSGKNITFLVTCDHISSELKTRNLFGYFDDDNGIDTCRHLMEKALTGTGWTLLTCDPMVEADGSTEKIRSFSCDEKTGAWTMIADICTLFQAYPVFHGHDRTIEVFSLRNHPSLAEITFGKNTDSIDHKPNSSNIVTRLYVQGDYLDQGYVGIDDADDNTYHLNFICNFDYYKQIGVFTAEHQRALDNFLNEKSTATRNLSMATDIMLDRSKMFAKIIGTYPVIYYKISDGKMSVLHTVNDPTSKHMEIKLGNEIGIVQLDADGKCVQYKYQEYEPTMSIPEWATHAVYFPITINGSLMTAENFAQVSESTMNGLEDPGLSPDDDNYDANNVYNMAKAQAEKSWAEARTYMAEGFKLAAQIETAKSQIAYYQDIANNCEREFAEAMGGMLREGYWTDTMYIPGQENALYADALVISEQMAFPTNTWSFNIEDLIMEEDVPFEINQKIRIYDGELRMNDDDGWEQDVKAYGYVEKMTMYPRMEWKDDITITTDELDLANRTFTSVMSRIADMADVLEQTRDVYDRAVFIGSDGTIPMEALQGMIDISKNKIMSQGSNWETDERGNILFKSLDELSAMMLTGMGFMIARRASKDDEWNWKTFGTGDGFTADLITTGFLSAERIAANSITVNQIHGSVGEELDLSKNTSITLTADQINAVANEIDLSANESVMITAEKINAVANEIDLSGNETVAITAEKINAVADDINLEGNNSVQSIVSNLWDIGVNCMLNTAVTEAN